MGDSAFGNRQATEDAKVLMRRRTLKALMIAVRELHEEAAETLIDRHFRIWLAAAKEEVRIATEIEGAQKTLRKMAKKGSA